MTNLAVGGLLWLAAVLLTAMTYAMVSDTFGGFASANTGHRRIWWLGFYVAGSVVLLPALLVAVVGWLLRRPEEEE